MNARQASPPGRPAVVYGFGRIDGLHVAPAAIRCDAAPGVPTGLGSPRRATTA